MDTTRPISRLISRNSPADMQHAYEAWRCTCGPIALACLFNATLDEVRPLLGEYRGLMNPTEMRAAITRAGCGFTQIPTEKLCDPRNMQSGTFLGPRYGVIRVQWGGPWTKEGARPTWAYHYTHWVASVSSPQEGPSFYDCIYGWMNAPQYFTNMAETSSEVPRGDGTWWPTHMYEIVFPRRCSTGIQKCNEKGNDHHDDEHEDNDSEDVDEVDDDVGGEDVESVEGVVDDAGVEDGVGPGGHPS